LLEWLTELKETNIYCFIVNVITKNTDEDMHRARYGRRSTALSSLWAVCWLRLRVSQSESLTQGFLNRHFDLVDQWEQAVQPIT
jgi:hypothetical protein